MNHKLIEQHLLTMIAKDPSQASVEIASIKRRFETYCAQFPNTDVSTLRLHNWINYTNLLGSPSNVQIVARGLAWGALDDDSTFDEQMLFIASGYDWALTHALYNLFD